MNYCKNSLSCWCFVFDVLHREYWPCMCVFVCVFVLHVFIPIYRGFERCWEFSRYINLSCLKLWFFTIDLLPDLIIVLWRANFKSIPLETEQGLQQYYYYSRIFRHSSSDAFLQTHSSRRSKFQIKFLCSLTCSIRIFMSSTLIWILYTWRNV